MGYHLPRKWGTREGGRKDRDKNSEKCYYLEALGGDSQPPWWVSFLTATLAPRTVLSGS